ncbi:MAG: hypothetical protein EOO91_21200 [Pedobacter sp.]|nr:MAG: hypothetical protein EOO91_21200 [Pedobacter sp.]
MLGQVAEKFIPKLEFPLMLSLLARWLYFPKWAIHNIRFQLFMLVAQLLMAFLSNNSVSLFVFLPFFPTFATRYGGNDERKEGKEKGEG